MGKEQQGQLQVDLVALPPVVVAAVLLHFRWSGAAVEDCCFADEQRVSDAIGLPQYCSRVLCRPADLLLISSIWYAGALPHSPFLSYISFSPLVYLKKILVLCTQGQKEIGIILLGLHSSFVQDDILVYCSVYNHHQFGICLLL